MTPLDFLISGFYVLPIFTTLYALLIFTDHVSYDRALLFLGSLTVVQGVLTAAAGLIFGDVPALGTQRGLVSTGMIFLLPGTLMLLMHFDRRPEQSL